MSQSVLAVASDALAGTVAPAAARPFPQRMHFNHRMRIETVCFSVTNLAGSQSTLYGQRFIDRPMSPRTPAIVLVHGVASSTENWDFSPNWSVARALAKAGYVVISYDRLGYAKSSYFDHSPHNRSEPSRLLPVLRDDAGLPDVRHLSAGRDPFAGEDRLHPAVY